MDLAPALVPHSLPSRRYRRAQTKTFDFVRTTRLSPAELMVGYLFGAPLLGYFTIGISVVVSIVVGIREGIPSEVIAINYAQLIVLSLIAGLIGLAVSTLIEKSWIVGGLPCCWFLRSGAACSTTPLKERLSRDSWHSHPSASRRGFTPVFLSSALICRFTPLRSFSI
jgi:hypothetical protein